MTSGVALSQATAVAERAAELAKVPWDQLEASEAPEVAGAIARASALLDAAMIGVAARLEATDAAKDLGWASAKDFLTHLLGGHKGTGGGLLRAAEQLQALPEVRQALETGAITLPQARAIAAKTTTLPRVPEFRAQVSGRLLELVAEEGYDATDLQHVFNDVVHDLDPDRTIRGEDNRKDKTERGAHHARHLSLTPDGNGGMQLRGYGTIEDAERIKTTLLPLSAPVTSEPGACGGHAREPDEELIDENGHLTATACADPTCHHDGRDPRDHGKRLWDACVDACDQLRATDTLPRDHGATPKVVVLIDQESLRQKVIDAGLARDGHTPSGQRLSATAIRRLACDADIIPAVLGAHGQVLDVGRTQRLVTSAIFIALVIRDRHCAFPGCSRLPLACDAHHIVHWADGGTTSLNNLILLCRHHHVVVHQTPWTVAIDPDTSQPIWTPPPKVDVRDRITYHPGQPRHHLIA